MKHGERSLSSLDVALLLGDVSGVAGSAATVGQLYADKRVGQHPFFRRSMPHRPRSS